MKIPGELLKTWRYDGFSLRVYHTGRFASRGTSLLAYRFRDKGKLIFDGSEYSPSPMDSDDGMETVYGILSFLSLRPGDTDREYFDKYTPEQLAWCESGRAEYLSLIVNEREEKLTERRRRKRA
jgi:hypothetical protein